MLPSLENPFAHILVTTVDSLVVGFVDFMITFDSATINQIAVKENVRAKGIGTRLIGEMIKVCKEQKDEVDFVTLEGRDPLRTVLEKIEREADELHELAPPFHAYDFDRFHGFTRCHEVQR